MPQAVHEVVEMSQLCAVDEHRLLLILEIIAVQNVIVGWAAPVSLGSWLELGLGAPLQPPESESAF